MRAWGRGGEEAGGQVLAKQGPTCIVYERIEVYEKGLDKTGPSDGSNISFPSSLLANPCTSLNGENTSPERSGDATPPEPKRASLLRNLSQVSSVRAERAIRTLTMGRG